MLDLNRIIELSGVHPLYVRNVYVYGSQVYGYASPGSDYDIVLVAPGTTPKEIKDPEYNIHHVMHDKFSIDVQNYNIRALECIYAPDWAKLKEKQKFDLQIVPGKLIGAIMSQSHDMWGLAKRKMYEGDIMRGNKGGFHSLKTLIFGLDILKNGCITDFSSIKNLHDEFYSMNFYRWDDLKDKYLPYKKELEGLLIK